MPWSNEWIPNELFLEYKGVCIFHVYKYNEGEAYTYRFGTASDSSYDDDTVFEVTDLPTWIEPECPPYINMMTDPPAVQSEKKAAWNKYEDEKVEENAIRSVIMAAIDGGYLTDYINAAADRPRDIPFLDRDNDLSDDQWTSAIELQQSLDILYSSAIAGVVRLFQAITNGTRSELSLGKEEVDYSDGADYTIIALRLKHNKEGDHFLIVQEEDDGPVGDEQDLTSMEIATLIELLAALEKMHADNGINVNNT